MTAINIIKSSQAASPLSFEEYYVLLRSREGRLYTDDVVKNLPLVSRKDPFNQEWILRRQSSGRLVEYFKNKNSPLRILEVGCGNGWLCHLLADIPGAKVTGSDINKTELLQAARVFQKPNLEFIQSDIRSGDTAFPLFDMIIFAASVQYFSSLPRILRAALDLLKPGGEIHILDSFFYKEDQIQTAKKRTADYYESLGLPGFALHYFHHSTEQLAKFHPVLMYHPSRFKNLFRKQNPFPWYCIKK
jgi:SAM-dependent methyltransferase